MPLSTVMPAAPGAAGFPIHGDGGRAGRLVAKVDSVAAQSGKNGHRFPVRLKVYDGAIRVLKDVVGRAKLGWSERLAAIRRLDD